MISEELQLLIDLDVLRVEHATSLASIGIIYLVDLVEIGKDADDREQLAHAFSIPDTVILKACAVSRLLIEEGPGKVLAKELVLETDWSDEEPLDDSTLQSLQEIVSAKHLQTWLYAHMQKAVEDRKGMSWIRVLWRISWITMIIIVILVVFLVYDSREHLFPPIMLEPEQILAYQLNRDISVIVMGILVLMVASTSLTLALVSFGFGASVTEKLNVWAGNRLLGDEDKLVINDLLIRAWQSDHILLKWVRHWPDQLMYGVLFLLGLVAWPDDLPMRPVINAAGVLLVAVVFAIGFIWPHVAMFWRADSDQHMRAAQPRDALYRSTVALVTITMTTITVMIWGTILVDWVFPSEVALLNYLTEQTVNSFSTALQEVGLEPSEVAEWQQWGLGREAIFTRPLNSSIEPGREYWDRLFPLYVYGLWMALLAVTIVAFVSIKKSKGLAAFIVWVIMFLVSEYANVLIEPVAHYLLRPTQISLLLLAASLVIAVFGSLLDESTERQPEGKCPQCENPIEKSDSFCKNCGHKLTRIDAFLN